jgi:hypothetical protein
MQRLAMLSPALLFFLGLWTTQHRLGVCLPSDIKLTDTVSAQIIRSDASGNVIKRLNVKESLSALKARCRRGRLVDGRGREIYFYRLTGCWGNPPANYLEILEHQRNELSNLKKRYTVVEMSCNTSGLEIQ